ncbi:MAG: GDSL-type esterase/lipase family protein [candidate division KSB1 bacterium]|nr:GDSL-type esterase/lipase family protein [candidate division KSB1 bacterium]
MRKEFFKPDPAVRKKLYIIYLLSIHLLLIGLLYSCVLFRRPSIEKTIDRTSLYYHRHVKYHLRATGNWPDGSFIFIGDSHIEGLCGSAVANPAVNLGIGKDTIAGSIARIDQYQNLSKAKCIILSIGSNDLNRQSIIQMIEEMTILIKHLPEKVPFICCGLFPTYDTLGDRNKKARLFNQEMVKLCHEYCTGSFIDIYDSLLDEQGRVNKQYYDADGIHLNSNGNAIWIKALRNQLAEHGA